MVMTGVIQNYENQIQKKLPNLCQNMTTKKKEKCTLYRVGALQFLIQTKTKINTNIKTEMQ